MRLHLIAAVAQNGVIGKLNALPWRLSGDLKNFKKITNGHTLLMGRKTWDSIPNAPLKNRTNIVLTSKSSVLTSESSVHNGAVAVHSYDEFKAMIDNQPGDCFVIGGRSVYELAMRDPKMRVMHITRVYADVDGDVYFPKFNENEWVKTNFSPVLHENGLDYRFIDYIRYQAGQSED